jgi:ATP-dependent exoDNAse (exonuclease V) beta subunit
MCVLYVALTRAKRGLYVLLPEVPKSRKEADEFSSLANWMRLAVGAEGDGLVWQAGEAGWQESVGPRVAKPRVEVPALGVGRPLRSRSTPSGEKKEAAVKVADSPTGKVFGSEVHAAFEAVGWVDEEVPVLPETDAGRLVAELLGMREVRGGFERGGKPVELFREQWIEAIQDGKWLSGVIDRLHVHDGGKRVEVIDFKTDAVGAAEELRERYAGQMEAYRRVMAQVFPGAMVECRLLSTRLRCWVEA